MMNFAATHFRTYVRLDWSVFMKKTIKKATIFSILTTILLFLANKVIFFLALVKELLPVSDGASYKWKFGSVFYKEEGCGTPLLLIHDLQADSSGYEWSRTVKALSNKHRVYIVDLPGCGRSDKPAMTYTNFVYVQFLQDFIKDVVREPVSLAAVGRSGSFTLLYASQNQPWVKKIVLINPQSFREQAAFPTQKDKIFRLLLTIPVFGTCVYNYCVSLRQISDKFREEYFYDKRACAAKYIQAYYEAAHLAGPSSRFLFASVAAGYTNMPVTHAMDRLSMPILLIGGEEQPAMAQTIAEYQKAQPAISSAWISHTKGLPLLEKPDSVVSVMEQFL